jgi:hypothetical protein
MRDDRTGVKMSDIRRFLLPIVCAAMTAFVGGASPPGCLTGLSATYSNSWERWDIDMERDDGPLATVFSGSPDRWNVRIGGRSGSIAATYSNSLERWNYGEVDIRTVYSGCWDRWEVTGRGRVLRVAADYSGEWTHWTVSGPAGALRVSATYSGDWTRWRIDDRMCGEDMELRLGAVFACMISAVWAHRQGK